jgi:hypothetical protein
LLAKDITIPAGAKLELKPDELIASVVITAAGKNEEPAVVAAEAAPEAAKSPDAKAE